MNIGDNLLWTQFTPTVSDPGTQTYTPSPYDISNSQAVIAGLAARLSHLEGAVRLQVSADTVISQILLTQDAALISSDKIAIVGEVTFADWHRTISGQIAGGLDPSITQIIGGVIKTGKVQSFDGLSWLNLDATGTTPFIQCQSAVSIEANGNFIFGATAGAQLTWDGTNLSLGGNSLLAGTSTSTVVSNASYGQAAYSGLSSKLNNNAADVLGGNITFTTSGAFQIGTATWNGTTATGTGIMYNEYGIVAVNAGVIEFVLNGTTGAATFSGALSAATGTFAGNVTSGGNVDVSGYVHATGSFSAAGYNNSISGITTVATNNGVLGSATTGSGVLGIASVTGTGVGVTGEAVGAGATAIVAAALGGAIALNVAGTMITNTNTLVSNLNAQYCNGVTFTGGASGTSTGTSVLTGKPGASTSSTWYQLTTVGGTAAYIQVWS